jgi:hypothetical protein
LIQKIYHYMGRLVPSLHSEDYRPGRIKYLDTCLALVSEEAMAAWLERQAKVDLSMWGKGKDGRGAAKEVADLLKEVKQAAMPARTPPPFKQHSFDQHRSPQVLSGESELRSDGTRVVRVVKVRIVDEDFELINTLQVPRPARRRTFVNSGVNQVYGARLRARRHPPGSFQDAWLSFTPA